MVSDLNNEIEELQLRVEKLKSELKYKTLVRDLVSNLNEMIGHYRGATISPDSATVVTTCGQLRAVLLAEKVGPPK